MVKTRGEPNLSQQNHSLKGAQEDLDLAINDVYLNIGTLKLLIPK